MADDTEAERVRILKMVEQGTISAEEGAKLLEAVEPAADDGVEGPAPGERPRWIRIQVWDGDLEQPKVNLRVPYRLAQWAANSGFRIARMMNVEELNELPQETGDLLREALQQTEKGKMIEVQDGDDRVEISLE